MPISWHSCRHESRLPAIEENIRKDYCEDATRCFQYLTKALVLSGCPDFIFLDDTRMPSTAEELSADTRKAASPLVDLRCGLDFRSDMGMDANPKRDQKVRETGWSRVSRKMLEKPGPG